jgi:hypothetical protein
MSKSYGITCDRCGKQVFNPGNHFSLILKNALNTIHIVRKDLCSDCMYFFEDLFSKPYIPPPQLSVEEKEEILYSSLKINQI